jgi:hypothetical protein
LEETPSNKRSFDKLNPEASALVFFQVRLGRETNIHRRGKRSSNSSKS